MTRDHANEDNFVDGFLTKVEANIEKYGHSGIQILGDDPENTFTYTVGLSDVHWPELIIFGIEPNNALSIINSVVSHLRSTETRPTAGMVIDKALSVPVKLGAIPHDEVLEHFKVALRRANEKGSNDEAIAGLQIVWPDTAGLFPGDDGYDSENFPQKVLAES